MNDHRKLIVLGLNEALARGAILLTIPSTDDRSEEHGHFMTELAGRPSVVMWSDIGYGELRVSVWWDYDHSNHPQANMTGNSRENFTTSRPLAKRSHYPKFVGATASGWLERKTGKHLQGKGSQGIFDTYLRRDLKNALQAVPTPSPKGYNAEGKFFI